MAYATEEQLAAYLGVDEEDLPAGSVRMLDRATELIEAVTFARYDVDTADAVVTERVVRATCAQVEFWNAQGGDTGDVDGGGGVDSYRTGTVSVTRKHGTVGHGSSAYARLAPRAKDALFMAGLLNAGMNIQTGVFSDDD